VLTLGCALMPPNEGHSKCSLLRFVCAIIPKDAQHNDRPPQLSPSQSLTLLSAAYWKESPTLISDSQHRRERSQPIGKHSRLYNACSGGSSGSSAIGTSVYRYSRCWF
jgi:hypothetical protein